MYNQRDTGNTALRKGRRLFVCVLVCLFVFLSLAYLLILEMKSITRFAKEQRVRKPEVIVSVESIVEDSQEEVIPVHSVLDSGTVFKPIVIDSSALPESYIKRHKFEFPPFLLSPPLLVSKQVISLPELSPIYKSWMEKRDVCDEEICRFPERYADDYREWRCKTSLRSENHHMIVPSCDDVTKGIPMFETEYVNGVVDFIEDGILNDDYKCGWKSDHHIAVKNKESKLDYYYVNGTAVFLIVPDGYSFQHFLDGVLPKIVQIQDLLPDKNVKYIVHLKKRFPIVRTLLHRIGIKDDQMIMKETFMPHSGRIKAKQLVIPCNTPPIHPYLWQRAQYLLKLPWLQSSFQPKRHLVVYLTRNSGAYNGGRHIMNEDIVLNAIRPIIELKGCELVTFIAKDYKKLPALLDFFSNAVAIFGPHGGALMNMLFIPRNSIVVEMMPNRPEFTQSGKEVHLIMYKQSQLLGLRYFAVFGEGDKNDNMIIPPSDLVSIFRDHL